jgi:hypothetical protein
MARVMAYPHAVAMTSKTKTKKSAAHGSLADCPAFHAAIEEFVRANNHFDSSYPVNAALEEMAKCHSFAEVFALPLQHKLFTMEVALHWALFLKLAPDRAAEEGDTSTLAGNFSADDAFDKIASIYDIGVQNAVWEHFEADDDDDEDAEDDEEDDDDAKPKKKGGK